MRPIDLDVTRAALRLLEAHRAASFLGAWSDTRRRPVSLLDTARRLVGAVHRKHGGPRSGESDSTTRDRDPARAAVERSPAKWRTRESEARKLTQAVRDRRARAARRLKRPVSIDELRQLLADEVRAQLPLCRAPACRVRPSDEPCAIGGRRLPDGTVQITYRASAWDPHGHCTCGEYVDGDGYVPPLDRPPAWTCGRCVWQPRREGSWGRCACCGAYVDGQGYDGPGDQWACRRPTCRTWVAAGGPLDPPDQQRAGKLG